MNSKITSYIYPIIIIIIFTLIGFLIYNIYFQPVQEGLETRIRREDGKLVKRRKKKSTKESFGLSDIGDFFDQIKDAFDKIPEMFKKLGENLKKTFEIFNVVKDIFNKITNFFRTIGDVFNYIPNLFRYLGSFIKRILDNIVEAFLYIPRVFVWLGSYITGGLRFITNLNKCFGWYSLDVFGQILYSPIKFLVWLFKLESIENMLWEYAENIDCAVKKATGYHLIHFSDSIQDRCYSFCPDEFPEFPRLNWRFDPPTLSIDTNW
jgi:hypothetical protein